jgi:hypothetical protein
VEVHAQNADALMALVEEVEEKFNTMNLVFEYEDREKIGDPSSSYRFYVRENKDLKEDTLL